MNLIGPVVRAAGGGATLLSDPHLIIWVILYTIVVVAVKQIIQTVTVWGPSWQKLNFRGPKKKKMDRLQIFAQGGRLTL